MVAVAGQAAGQITDYDSRTEPAPYVFDWNNNYNLVQIHDNSFCEFHGGFISTVRLYETASGIVHQGMLDIVQTDDHASLTVFGGNFHYIAARGDSTIDVYDATMYYGNVEAGDQGLLRIHGGTMNRVYTWPSGGMIEMDGNTTADELSAESGIVRQNGGVSGSLSCAYGGLAILDRGTVSDFMSASDVSTLVLAGGVPPEDDIRLFGGARMLVFHSGAVIHGSGVEPKHVKLRMADFDEPGNKSNFAGISLFLTLDGCGYGVRLSAWNAGFDLQWTGSVDLIRLDDELYLEVLPGSGAVLLAFTTPNAVVIQVEVSDDLVHWQPSGDAVVGDGGIHTEVTRFGGEKVRYFRLHKWVKP